MSMNETAINEVGRRAQENANLIWNAANSLFGAFKPHEYGLVILPMCVIKRFHDCLLPTHEAVLAANKEYDFMGELKVGFLKEAAGLYERKGLNALNTVGYKELFDYFEGRWTLKEAIERIKGNTRRYARKQLTWYKRDEDMHWFHPNDKQELLNYLKHYE